MNWGQKHDNYGDGPCPNKRGEAPPTDISNKVLFFLCLLSSNEPISVARGCGAAIQSHNGVPFLGNTNREPLSCDKEASWVETKKKEERLLLLLPQFVFHFSSSSSSHTDIITTPPFRHSHTRHTKPAAAAATQIAIFNRYNNALTHTQRSLASSSSSSLPFFFPKKR